MLLHKLRYILVITLISVQCMGQRDFDEKVNSLLDRSVPLISSQQLSDSLEAGEEIILLDTRGEDEYAVSHLRGARFIDYDDFSIDMVSNLKKDSPIVIYCSVGYRSEKIGEKLLEAGYTKVFNLYGGIFGWKNSGRKVVNADGLATDSVHTYNESWSKWLVKGVKVYD